MEKGGKGRLCGEGVSDLILKDEGKPGKEGRTRKNHSRLKEWPRGIWDIEKAGNMAASMTRAYLSLSCLLVVPNLVIWIIIII